MTIFVFDKVEKIVGKGENAGYQHFRLFPQFFSKASLLRSLKVEVVWLRVEGRGGNQDFLFITKRNLKFFDHWF